MRRDSCMHYRGTSLIRNSALVGPFSRIMPRGLRWSQRGGLFLKRKVPLYLQHIRQNLAVSSSWGRVSNHSAEMHTIALGIHLAFGDAQELPQDAARRGATALIAGVAVDATSSACLSSIVSPQTRQKSVIGAILGCIGTRKHFEIKSLAKP